VADDGSSKELVSHDGDRAAAPPIEHTVSPDFESFCASIYPRLVGALSLAFGDHRLAEELAQEALSRVLERWEHVGALDDVEGYTFQTVFNLTRSWWRRRAAEHRAHSRAETGGGDRGERDPARALAVRDALNTLSRRQREVIVHRYYLDQSVSVTARSMGCAEGTVKALTAQALTKLRAVLGDIDE
jgi:RNA polymerase sigma factor (sigma-70 family)